MIDPKKIEEWKEVVRAATVEFRDSSGWVRRGEEPQYRFVGVQALAQAAKVLLAEREEMLAVLRELEWSGLVVEAACPICEAYSGTTHAPDCRLAALIR